MAGSSRVALAPRRPPERAAAEAAGVTTISERLNYRDLVGGEQRFFFSARGSPNRRNLRGRPLRRQRSHHQVVVMMRFQVRDGATDSNPPAPRLSKAWAGLRPPSTSSRSSASRGTGLGPRDPQTSCFLLPQDGDFRRNPEFSTSISLNADTERGGRRSSGRVRSPPCSGGTLGASPRAVSSRFPLWRCRP